MKKILVAAWLMLLGVGGLYAAGTPANTQVTNTVELAYWVGGVEQTQIDANDTDGFVVDKIIDFTLTHDDTPRHLVVVPGATDQVRIFTLTNTGNAVQDFTLLATNLTGSEVLDGKTDTKDASNFEYSLDSSSWNSTPPTINDLAVDTNVTIYVRSDIPAAPTAENGDIINIQLEATAVQNGTTDIEVATGAADDKDTVDTVLGEGEGITAEGNTEYDAQFSAWAGYEVQSAALAVTKTSCVISDPVNDTTNPKRIPGAVLRYQIQIENTGTSNATDVSVVDTISSEFGDSAANLEVWTGACPAISSGVCGAKTGTEETGNSHTGAGTASVTLDYDGIAAGVTDCGYIEVTIQ